MNATSKLATAGVLLATAGALAGTVSGGPQQEPGAQFRGRTDLIQLDVSVVDKNHQPVRGLTAADFTVLENKKPQTIDAFVPVNLADEPVRAPGWMRDVAPDVASNTGVDEDRLVVIVMDDYSADVGKDLWAQRSAKEIGRGIVDRLGPRDLAAVVFTVASRNNQEFTHDRARLLTAVEKFNPDAALPEFAAFSVLERVCAVLGSVAQRRKAVIWVSPGVVPPGTNLGTVIRIAQAHNVNIYPIDPTGIRVATFKQPEAGGAAANATGVPTLREEVERTNDIDRLNALRGNMFTLAGLTGGHSFQWNEFTKSLNQVFRETGSFYLIGYASSNTTPDGKLRALEVKVNRRGVTVNARSGYWPDASAPLTNALPPVPPSPSIEALSGLVPTRGVPLQITAVPFSTGAIPAVAVTLAVPAPVDDPDDVDVVLKAFTFDGNLRQTRNLRAHVDPRAPAVGADGQVQIVDRLDLAPGRYQLRAGVTSMRRKTSGSVYADLDVPDFSKEPLSLSGVTLGDPLSPSVVSAEAEGRLLPVIPITTRVFDATTHVTSLLEVYQGTDGGVQPVEVTARIRNDLEQVVFNQTEAIPAGRFDTLRRAQHRMVVPLSTLKPGEYLLTFEAMAGKLTARRDVRFAVRQDRQPIVRLPKSERRLP